MFDSLHYKRLFMLICLSIAFDSQMLMLNSHQNEQHQNGHRNERNRNKRQVYTEFGR